MKNHLVMTLVAVLAAPMVSAGIFGPDNYDECMLDYLKGESGKATSAVLLYAEKACEQKFPYSKDITALKESISTSWWTESGKVFLEITENFSGYNVDRVSAKLLPVCKPLDVYDKLKNQEDSISVNFTFRGNVSQSSVSVDDGSIFNCMRTEEMYGTKKR